MDLTLQVRYGQDRSQFFLGLAYGGKPHILDEVEILSNIWNKDGKYARSDGIQRCWSKADTLTDSWNADINNDVCSASLLA